MPEGVSTLLLLGGMVMTATWSITSARWVDDIQTIEWAALVGLFAGVLLSKTRFPTVAAHLFSLIYGVAWVSYLGSMLLPSGLTFRDRLFELGFHINAWLWSVLYGGSSNDALMFVLFLACVVWLVAYAAAWATFRSYRIWWAILPSGTVLLINLYWGPPRLLPFLIVYVCLVLLYFIRFNLFQQQQNWSKERVRYDPEIAWDFLRYGVVFILIIVVLAWGVPGAAASDEMATFWSRFSEPWEQVQDTWNRLFFSSRYYGRSQPAAFGTSMTLGGAVQLGTQVVMDVASPAGRYWRATIYDEYTGSGWLNNDDEMAYLEAFDANFLTPQFDMRRVITQTYTVYQPGRQQLLAAAEPLGVSLPTKVRHSTVQGRLPGERRQQDLFNVSMISSRAPLESGQSYLVISAMSAVDEASLRAAGAEYPVWVTARYLQLPALLPQRVRNLAQEITRDATNAYDMASALEAYLRQIPYNQVIPPPPSDQDLVDWFLFDLREGYCDYYSSALVVMARAVGIPARVAVGYGRGEYNSESKTYRVRDNNAHAWAEVYFPGYGWIEFEPTAAEPVIVRPRPPSENAGEANGDRSNAGNERDEMDRWRELLENEPFSGSLPPLQRASGWSTALWVAGGLLLLAWVMGASYWWIEERGLRGLDWVQKAYARMVRFGGLLRVSLKEPQTPFEYAAELGSQVPAGQGFIHRITELFVMDQFSPHAVDKGESAALWHSLRPRLWRRWLGRWLERFQATEEETSTREE
ncbi:MAG: transglutaminase TgpA family protein [Chloroflexota bacterium]